ncbi:MAG: LysM peptidoglycan-binding domain-containing protein [Flavobacteriaceae bacterium]|nr:LysM peptidoglycan-binding domain-containing protein [Flavobacteriaceae bacterium]
MAKFHGILDIAIIRCVSLSDCGFHCIFPRETQRKMFQTVASSPRYNMDNLDCHRPSDCGSIQRRYCSTLHLLPILMAFKHIIFLVIALFLNTNNLHSQSESTDSPSIFKDFNPLEDSQKLQKAMKKLHAVFKNQGKKGIDTMFTIIHIGDSHIQGDYFSGEIRRLLQGYFGNAGQGLLFPYALAKSYGPRGALLSQKGGWTGIKTLTPNLLEPLGLNGYGAVTHNENAQITIAFNEKFNDSVFQRINIWHTADPKSYITRLNDDFSWAGSQLYTSGWGVSSYTSRKLVKSFTLTALSTHPVQNHYGFYGFELLPTPRRGIAYHHCGVAGAQFTHLIEKAPWTIEQIAHLKPDIVIFSFGTNESYNGKHDSAVYSESVQKFLSELVVASPQTAIIITTAPDTRSRNLIPPKQISVNNQLKTLAKNAHLTLYDLNTAMGGWGSMNLWYKNKLTLADKLHFTASGYALQGKLFSLSFMQFYNKVNEKDTLPIDTLRNAVCQSMENLWLDYRVLPLGDSTKPNKTLQPIPILVNGVSSDSLLSTSEPKTISNLPPHGKTIPQKKKKLSSNKKKITSSGEKIHTVRKGENLYRIGKLYHVSHESIAKKNHLNNPKAIKPGQLLIIPKK